MKITRRAFGALAAAGVARSATPGLDEQVVFRSGGEGYHTFRIPSLLTTPKGTLLAFSEGRRLAGGDSGAIDLVVKRSEDGGDTWSAPQVVWRDRDNTCPSGHGRRR